MHYDLLHLITMNTGAVIGAAVGASLTVLLTVVTIIIVITVVYLLRRSRYRHYQIAMSMSRLDDDESTDQLIT